MRKFALILAAIAVALTGCKTIVPTTPGSQRAVYEAEQGFAVALEGAIAYKQLPPCGQGVPGLCHDDAVVVKIDASAHAARAALDTAESLVRTGGAVEQVNTAVAHAQDLVTSFAAAVSQVTK